MRFPPVTISWPIGEGALEDVAMACFSRISRIALGLFDHHPVIPSYADLEDVAILLCPSAEQSRRLWQKFIANTH